MKMFTHAAAAMSALFFAGQALAHETGVAHTHDGAAGHPVFGVDHLLIVLAALALVALWAWRNR